MLGEGQSHPPSNDKASLGNDEFGVPEDPVEQVRFKRRLMATARSLQRKQEKLTADQDALEDRWTKILAAKKYELESPNKGHTRHNWLPHLEQENHGHAHRRPHITTIQGGKQHIRRGTLRPRHKGHKHQNKEAGAKSGNAQSDKQAKSNTSLLDRRYTLDQPCEIHGTPRRRQSIPIENAGFSKQSGWSHAGSNKGEMPRQDPLPRA